MSTTLDSSTLFDEKDLTIQVGSWARQSVERAMAGLDGIASIDLGGRRRTIRQRGVLRAPSQAALDERLDAIEAFLDGDTHTLVTTTGASYVNLRLDSFTLLDRSISGAGIVASYEIVYTQLGS